MTEWAVRILIIAGATWGILALVRPGYAFQIRVSNGEPRVHRGKVTRAFLELVAETCRDDGVRYGWIGGVRRGRRVLLTFSRHFPPGTQQRLRNQWHATG